MIYRANYETDIGISKKINQDCLCIKKCQTTDGELLMAVLCDGMGGLAEGEVASSSVVMDFSDWFEKLEKTGVIINQDQVQKEWSQLIQAVNTRIFKYGQENGIQLGTTLTAILLYPDGKYIVGHVGDTRLYSLINGQLNQVTEDQSFVAREVKMGRMTLEQAKTDKRRNVLLQCVGGQKVTNPSFYFGTAAPQNTFLICSDGFRHELEDKEIQDILVNSNPDGIEDKEILHRMIEVNMHRGERDNITAIIIRTF